MARGGTLLQDCAEHLEGSLKHDYFPGQGFERDHLAHQVRVEPGSRLHRALGSDSPQVNSMHHQGILRLGEGLRPTAWAPDGLIEAVEGAAAEPFLLGVQWHPEVLMDGDAGTRRLFADFVAACAAYHQRQVLVG